jgi:hypothetical protein
MAYWPNGAIAKLVRGNNLWRQVTINNRMQFQSLIEDLNGSSGDESELWRSERRVILMTIWEIRGDIRDGRHWLLQLVGWHYRSRDRAQSDAPQHARSAARAAARPSGG